MTSPEFRGWPKTPRLFRDIVITEKIDGTNAAIIIEEGHPSDPLNGWCAGVSVGERVAESDVPSPIGTPPTFYKVGAQSRNRIITPDSDNFGFARWVQENAHALAEILGVGYHYGEWWGSGIQRGYGLAKGEKRFSLFNVHRYKYIPDHPAIFDGLDVVPTLYAGPFSEEAINLADLGLRTEGSQVAPGFDNPEGFVVYHSASKQVYKVLLEGDDTPKSVLGRT